MSEVQAFVKLCGHCNQPMVEIARNEYYVFFKCGCHRHKGAEWDWRTALVDGVELELGTAGSFVLECHVCHSLMYRSRITGEFCLQCGETRVEPRLFRGPPESDRVT